ncbi:hypothetical protein [Halalkalibacter akibai]|nr:hypothetical protein [Halalkalibacter akibai]
MLRGGSFLLQKDFRIHQYFLNDVVTNKHYHKYCDPKFQQSMTKANVEGINELIQNTINAYTSNILEINGQDKLLNITDTLSSKILLGVYGNVPAYDRYLKAALSLHGIKSQFGEDSLLEITEFYNLNRTKFEECQRLFSQDGTHYTPMKLVDMYFWQVGFIMDNPKDASEEIQALIKATFIKPQMPDYIRTETRPVVNKGLTESIRKHYC